MSEEQPNITDLRNICQPKKVLERECETWYTRMWRRTITLYFTAFFIKHNVSANQVSILGFLITVLGALLLLTGNLIGWIIAGILFHLSLVLDLVDGELARYFKTSSITGNYLDGSLGLSGKIILIPSMFIGLYNQTQNTLLLFGGLFALTCLSIYLIIRLQHSCSLYDCGIPMKKKEEPIDSDKPKNNKKNILKYFAIPFTQIFWIANIIILSSTLDFFFNPPIPFMVLYLIAYITATFIGMFILFRQSINETEKIDERNKNG